MNERLKLKKRNFVTIGIVVALISLVAAACGDNSIDTRVDPVVQPKLSFPVEVTKERVSAGESVYAQHCSSCHGPVDGQPVIEGAPPHGDSGHTWHHPDRLLFQWILDKPPLATTMPAFRGVLSDDQVLDVMAYIKDSWLPEIQDRQNEGSVQYETQVIEFGSE